MVSGYTKDYMTQSAAFRGSISSFIRQACIVNKSGLARDLAKIDRDLAIDLYYGADKVKVIRRVPSETLTVLKHTGATGGALHSPG